MRVVRQITAVAQDIPIGVMSTIHIVPQLDALVTGLVFHSDYADVRYVQVSVKDKQRNRLTALFNGSVWIKSGDTIALRHLIRAGDDVQVTLLVGEAPQGWDAVRMMVHKRRGRWLEPLARILRRNVDEPPKTRVRLAWIGERHDDGRVQERGKT